MAGVQDLIDLMKSQSGNKEAERKALEDSFRKALNEGDSVGAAMIGEKLGLSGTTVKDLTSNVQTGPQEGDLDTLKSNLRALDDLLSPSEGRGLGSIISNLSGDDNRLVMDRMFGVNQAIPEYARFLFGEQQRGQTAMGNIAGEKFLEAYARLKGGGHISDAEGKKAEAAMNMLLVKDEAGRYTATEEQAERELKILRQIVSEGIRRFENGYISLDGLSKEAAKKAWNEGKIGDVFEINGKLATKGQ